MDNKLQALDYIIILIMLAFSSAIGIYFRFTGGRQKTIEEYLMGDKKMKMFPVSVSLMAAYMSANSILGVPSETYLFGTQYLIWMFGAIFGSIIAIYAFLPVYFDMNINSVNEYLGIRFGQTTRSIVAVLQVLKTIFYTAVVLYSPSLALNAVTGISTWAAAVCMSVICTFYCSLGGLKAVLWTDIFQAILMYTTLAAVIIGGIQTLGFIEILTKSNDGGRLIFFNFSPSLTERYTFWNCMIYGMFLNVSAYGSSQIELQRILSIGGLRKGQWSVLYGTIFSNIFLFMCIWSGIVIFAMFEDCDPTLSSTEQPLSPDQLIPLTIMKLFSNIPGLAGLCVAGIFSAFLSTISSAINSMTSITVEDFLKPYSDCKCFIASRMAFTAKLLTLVYGVLCLLLSLMVANFRGILEANTIMGGMIGGPITGIFMLGMFFKDANQVGSLFGLLSGFLFGLWTGFGTYIAKPKVNALPRSTRGCNSIVNETIFSEEFYLNSFGNNTKLCNDTSNSLCDDEEYVFPLYEMSFLWIPVFACLVTLISGIIGSYLLICCIAKQDVHPKTLSPIVRSFYFRAKLKTFSKADPVEMLAPGTKEQRSFNTFPETHMKKT
ncbi:sodium-coupled monocarboxylate transporter 1-like [Parasteatoda tepidariorum]|uniref:sodium-coupled monocarboxylate transporter 1-like n=1 Tax=Parasteatoda tepidariorum TaxID=114398 RepID=UPI0039BC5184